MKKFIDVLTTILWYFTAVLVFASIVVISMQIIWRYAFRNPIGWTEQIGRYLFVWIVMMAVPVGLWRQGLYSFDLLLSKLKGRAAMVVKTINYLACLCFSGYFFYNAMYLCINGGWRFAQGVHIQMIWLYIAQPICAGSMFIIFLYQFIQMLKAGPSAGTEKGGAE